VSTYRTNIFIRHAGVPDTPTGGTYDAPLTADMVIAGWQDGIPANDSIGNPVYMSSRLFTSNGKSPQEETWSTPILCIDTSNFDVCYSSSTSQPEPPDKDDHGTQTGDWHNEAQIGDIWMATSTCSNGVWSDWQVIRILGEAGKSG